MGYVRDEKKELRKEGRFLRFWNLLFDDMDKELEHRGHRFCRYADDCNIYVHSQKAGERVLESMTAFLAKRLKLRVNSEKSAVDYVHNRKFLGYRIHYTG
jgi:RNA-directed DNA polymerase